VSPPPANAIDDRPASQVADEARRILTLTRSDTFAAFQVLERQLAVVMLRTQVLLSLCGIVITVTGFSGRAIAQTSLLARLSITGGIVVVLAAAAVAIVGVLRLKWMTQTLADDPLATLVNAIEIRERKTRYLGVAQLLFVCGFALYCTAIAQLLMAARPV
jgi:hypothetical protein